MSPAVQFIETPYADLHSINPQNLLDALEWKPTERNEKWNTENVQVVTWWAQQD
jgi:hypothetical protein